MTLTLTRLWIIISTFLVSAGWLLSALQHLDRLGYGIVLAVGSICGPLALRRYPVPLFHFRSRRFRRALPLAFLILACLVLVSGFLYAPNNYDALSYRLPRTLHWLAEGRWHWIHTDSPRLNTRAADCEWIMAPLLLFARSERWLWLANAAMFAALPGLIFSTFIRVGVRRKVAWHWMWILPTGYVFLLQAGGISNDLPGTFYALAAVALALRASATGCRSDLWLSALSVALSQGVKASNAPLALLWLIASFPAWRLALARPLQTAAVTLAAALISFLPTAVLNSHFCGDWSGGKPELGDRMQSPAWVLISGNVVALTVQNFTPPIFPLAARWNDSAPALFPPAYRERLAHAFEGNGTPWRATDLQIEDSAPLGLGVSLLLLFATATAVCGRNTCATAGNPWLRAVRWSPWLALLVFVAKVGLIDSGRLIAPYYLLLPMAILAGRGQTALLQSRFWRALVSLQLASAAILLILLPSRPLWPALTILDALKTKKPDSALLQRLQTVYFVYRHRSDALAPVRALIPPEATRCGLVTGDDLETSLWRPFGTREFVHVTKADSRQTLDTAGLVFIVADAAAFARYFEQPLPDWLRAHDAELVRTVPVVFRAAQGPVDWHLIRLRPSEKTWSGQPFGDPLLP